MTVGLCFIRVSVLASISLKSTGAASGKHVHQNGMLTQVSPDMQVLYGKRDGRTVIEAWQHLFDRA